MSGDGFQKKTGPLVVAPPFTVVVLVDPEPPVGFPEPELDMTAEDDE